jgi:hypothetical protein
MNYLGSIHTASDGLLSTSFYNYTTIAEFLPLQHNNQPQTQSENQNTPQAAGLSMLTAGADFKF